MENRLTLAEIQKAELDILIEFDNICKSNNLKYGLCGGTLLGAVRHKGFIPWDDDIDVEMPRPDYDRLVKLSDKVFPNHLFMQTPYSDKLTTHSYAKICDLRTTLIEFPDTKRIKTHLYIDVFPIDGLPVDPIKKERHRKRVHNLALLNYGFRVSKYKKITSKNVFANIFWIVIKLLNKLFQNNFLIKRVEKAACKFDYNTSKFAGVIVAGYGPREIMPHIVCEFDNSIDFCGLKFSCTNKIDYYLTTIYGDYMTLPPIEQREGHEMECYKN